MNKNGDTQPGSLINRSSRQKFKEPYEMLEGITPTTIPTTMGMQHQTVLWTKNKAISIKGLDQKPISSLENKLRYSYSISPIKSDGEFSVYIRPIILFETIQYNGDDLEVTNFYLDDDPQLDFNTRTQRVKLVITVKPYKTELSKEAGYDKANPFWIANKNREVIMALTQSQYIKATITVNNKTKNTITDYKILLDSTYFVRLIQETLNKYPQIKTVEPDFRL
ncbi:p23 cell envelope protein (plasmid) [Borrelia puertoricensis]|uniref:BB0158 famile outer surface lipoprotein n=1 Tax=Borrelia puertoricensis TaxID=2756107 RepID=UPI001FF517B2|nr:p23 cell envelope protein [Borrelia puertoricensis]UPA19000.1 p23 cell envelope protein [Borrelia puertoricensis]